MYVLIFPFGFCIKHTRRLFTDIMRVVYAKVVIGLTTTKFLVNVTDHEQWRAVLPVCLFFGISVNS